MSPPSDRYYLIRDAESKAPVALVKGTSGPQALKFYVSGKLTVEFAEQEAMIEAVGAGIKPVDSKGNEGDANG